jgi:carbamoyl-phosphate synthase large subunit
MPPELPQRVLVLGSGALKIGEAGEFDYSGSQAVKALREEGITTIVMNPNIATIQTSPGLADRVYLLPVDPETVTAVIRRERPDAILISCGGQTALNCGLALWRSGVLEAEGVRVLGTPIEAVEVAEDRRKFAELLGRIGVPVPRSIAAHSMAEAVRAAETVGYPVMVRLGFALGGMGSGRCADRAELEKRVERALAHSPQVLVEEYLEGWREVEYEIMRDREDNCIAICNMENLDPLGIHTGESIVVAPSQTLDNDEYHRLRSVGFQVFRALGLVGEGNIQFALHPTSGEYRVIEVNPRLSRSSALASKATGYPIAYMATKLAAGRALTALKNSVTGSTLACFEPALDYVVVKIPRWDLARFALVAPEIGSGMKSVGEVMAIGRGFEEALQKALRMLDARCTGLIDGAAAAPLPATWAEPTPDRILHLARALEAGVPPSEIERRTHIHPWFVDAIRNVVAASGRLRATRGAPPPRDLLLEAKQLGFSDQQVGSFCGIREDEVRSARHALGLRPCVKQIDTLAGEYPASTNYLFLTWNGSADDVARDPAGGRPVMILGAGPYRIGTSVEFDWCCVESARAFRKRGIRTVIVNCNPETVSTDYDESDRLYFEELSLESLIEIGRLEDPFGVVVSMGGQIANSLAGPLKAAGFRVLGTDPDDIDRAEDRHAFSRLLDGAGIHQPPWTEARSLGDVLAFCERVGFPVLVRPSYVLSGSAMAIATGPQELETYLARATESFSRGSVVISRFIEDAKEIELDGVAVDGDIVAMTMSEHVENAGVHSGDATVVVPPQRIFAETARRVRRIGRQIAQLLRITGVFNIQFVARENDVMVIECNLRASRTLPFVSKVTAYPYADATVAALLGEIPPPESSSLDQLSHVGVKAPQFSFSSLRGADPRVGVEMASTGEVGCLGEDFDEAFLKALRSVGFRFPIRAALVSTGRLKEKVAFVEGARQLASIGVTLYATPGSARFLRENGIAAVTVGWPDESGPLTAESVIVEKKVDLVINIPKNNLLGELSNDFRIRRAAIDFKVPLITNIQVATRLASALARGPELVLHVKALDEYHQAPSRRTQRGSAVTPIEPRN